MKRLLLPLLLALPAVAQDSPAPSPVPSVRLQADDKVGRTYAEGSPFIIWGGQRPQRSHLFSAATLVRRAVLEALHLPDTWSHPIVLQLREPLAQGSDARPPVWTTISQVEGGFRLEINLVPQHGAVPGPLLQENLVRAILADRILRGQEKRDLANAPSPPPDWLLHGTLALLEYRQLGRMSQTFSRIFQLGRVLSAADILNADPAAMDSVSLTVYQVSSGALLMMLIEQPSGPQLLANLLPSLALPGIDYAQRIEQAFPALTGSANSLSKWWSLQVASLSQPGLDEVATPAETERQLADALVLRFTSPPPEAKRPSAIKRLFAREPVAALPDPASPPPASFSAPLQDYPRVLALPDPAPPFNQVDLALTRLMLRAHPVYRPLIQEYQTAVRLLAKGKPPKTLPTTLNRLASTREKLAATLRQIEDHLDWFQTTQSTSPSGAFDGYLKTADQLDQAPPPRPDPLSRYLDEIEAASQP